MDTSLIEAINSAANHIAHCDALVITAGAGMGVDSGLPDFRGDSGFWKAYPVVAKLGINFYEMANPQWFKSDPELAWAFYGHRLNLYRATRPHAGFATLLNWSHRLAQGAFAITSNVDGQFGMAGFAAKRVIEVHGSIHHLQCTKPCCSKIWPADEFSLEVDMELFRAVQPLPTCPYCGAVARPNILMFGDGAWLSARESDQKRHLEAWLNGLGESRVVVLEIGAGRAVPTIRNYSRALVNRYHAVLVRINPRDFEVPSGQIALPLGANEAIAAIDNALKLNHQWH